jgi:hypothetical protein
VRLSNGIGDEISMAKDEVSLSIWSSFEFRKPVVVDALQRGWYGSTCSYEKVVSVAWWCELCILDTHELPRTPPYFLPYSGG